MVLTVCCSVFISFFEKGFTLKGKNLGSKFFPFRADPFS